LGKRLWQGAFALGLFLVLLFIGNLVCDPAKALNSHMVGHDFLAFYTGGDFVRTGQLDQLYNLDAVRVFQHHMAAEVGLNLGDSFGPFWNPPC
jgi:hypothetical protein